MIMTHTDAASPVFSELASLRDTVSSYRSELLQEMRDPGGAGLALARRHSEHADDLACRVFKAARQRHSFPLLLGAVGGFGRQLLALGSDLDLCFVTTEQPDVVAECIESMLYPLWDAGVSVGHQIIWPSQAVADASADVSMATELLDFRPLAGDEGLMDAVQQMLADSIFSDSKIGSFIEQLEADANKRHQNFGDSVYLLEPDVKNGTGGLRDLDTALWAARARFGTSNLKALVQLGALAPEMGRETLQAMEFLWTVRNHLHRVAGRKADRLTFTEQENVARAMGYERERSAKTPQLQRVGEMVEAFMSDYYRHARCIARCRDRLVGRAKRRQTGKRPEVIPLSPDWVTCEGRVGLREPQSIEQEPELAFRVYVAAVSRGMPVLSRTRDAITNLTQTAAFQERLRSSREAARLFVVLCCSSRTAPFPSGSILTELHDVGLLLAMIPEFAPVVGRVHHDLYHVYTVDVHSIAAVDRLHALVRGDLPKAQPLGTRLAAEISRPRVLFLATLLHDVGKAIGGRNHAQRGAEMGRDILGRLGFSEEEIEHACHLIRQHLVMYMVATRRDLNDPMTIQAFVRSMPDRESLRELYLLTVADVSTTSLKALTKWKRSMLDALFRASDGAMAGAALRPTDRVARVRTQARLLWQEQIDSQHEEFEQFLDSMPQRYFLANTPVDVVAHAKLAVCREAPLALSVTPSNHDGALGLCVVAEGQLAADLCVVAVDRPGLLEAITAAISANGLDIQAAQVNSRLLSSGNYQAVDLFWVRGPIEDESLERRLAKLEQDLADVIAGKRSPHELLRTRRKAQGGRATPGVDTQVLFDHHASEHYTVIEVLAEDRPALLFTLATGLHALNISIVVAKISTEGKRAIDVLYVTEANGSKVEPGARTEEVRAHLLQSMTDSAALQAAS